jgi:carbon starvation protein
MTVLLVMLLAGGALLVLGRLYSGYLSREIGEVADRPTPALSRADGRDYVATPTPVVFAHHFASIAGAGPILGPVIAIVYGWLPALIWVVLGGVFLGAVHDYLATYIATREGGQSLATVARRLLGKEAFVAVALFIALVLALVCAAFLNASATALTSMLPFDRIEMSPGQSLFRTVSTARGEQVVIGGIASMSVVCITALAPLLGWLYIKKRLNVWLCSALAVGICAVSITIGLFQPITLDPVHWKLLLSVYVLIAAGVPVWIFLQSRDFINVHILYVGMAALLATLVVAGLRGGGSSEPLPAWNLRQGTEALHSFWPFLFITIACGAVSGFHSLCAGGTTCKQVRSERDTRRVGYYAMLLESFLAVCVIAVLLLGATRSGYLSDMHPKLIGSEARGNAVLSFAMAVGNAGRIAWKLPVYVGALAGMVLLEGFLVTTLDTAIRLTRYLLEEVWRTMLGHFDVFAAPISPLDEVELQASPTGAGGIPPAVKDAAQDESSPIRTRGALRGILLLMRQYWFNSALAVGLMLVFALSGGQKTLWPIFAASNQLLAAMGLSLAAIWLYSQGRKYWFALVPAVIMLATTVTALSMMLVRFIGQGWQKAPLVVADVTFLVLTVFLLVRGLRVLVRGRQGAPASS